MRQILIILASIFVFSCKQTNTYSKNLRDTIIERYLAMIATSGKYDTTDLNYKVLKAYVQNDLTSLKHIDSLIVDQTKNRMNWDLWTNDIPLPTLNQLDKDEAYRFIFSINGSSYEAITVSKKAGIFKLHYLFYGRNRETSKFNKIKEYEKDISESQWNKLTNKIQNADFWGLKNENGYRGDDGNDITVIGFKKSENFFHDNYVHRWSNTTLNDAFYFIYYTLLDKKERRYGNN